MLLVCAPSLAQVDGPSRVSLTWENDTFARTDRHYTNGLRVELSGRIDPGALPAWLAGDETEWGLAVGQQIFTPERIDETDLVMDDRPYAGWAYVGLSVRRTVAALGWKDRIELTLGVVGPASGAKLTHEQAHALNGSARPRGWGHQLRDEAGFVLGYRASKQVARGGARGLGYDVTPTLGVSLGNVATFMSLGIAARAGLGVPIDDATRAAPPLRAYLTASVEVRLVGHDIFLDGNLLRSGSHRVEKERVVADLTVGIVVAIHARVSVTYRHTVRSPEFVGQTAADQFGSLALSISW